MIQEKRNKSNNNDTVSFAAPLSFYTWVAVKPTNYWFTIYVKNQKI